MDFHSESDYHQKRYACGFSRTMIELFSQSFPLEDCTEDEQLWHIPTVVVTWSKISPETPIRFRLFAHKGRKKYMSLCFARNSTRNLENRLILKPLLNQEGPWVDRKARLCSEIWWRMKIRQKRPWLCQACILCQYWIIGTLILGPYIVYFNYG